jgi:hypothetical protein
VLQRDHLEFELDSELDVEHSLYTVVTPRFIGPHWLNVKPFAVPPAVSGSGPAKYGVQAYLDQAQTLVDISATLTDEQKVIAEYWADGPHSELPPGHWDLFAQFVARRDRHGAEEHGVDLDVKLFFALTNAIFDAGICAWSNMRVFNSVRPITAIRYLFDGQKIRAWAGPYAGAKEIDGAEWLPYQASTFPTPPFAEYSSGHSNFSAAGAEILRLFTGSERFAASVRIGKGESRFESGLVPAQDVTLAWATFKEAADRAGISRRYGGIHFLQSDLEARLTGRQAAAAAWAKALTYWNGRLERSREGRSRRRGRRRSRRMRWRLERRSGRRGEPVSGYQRALTCGVL